MHAEIIYNVRHTTIGEEQTVLGRLRASSECKWVCTATQYRELQYVAILEVKRGAVCIS